MLIRIAEWPLPLRLFLSILPSTMTMLAEAVPGPALNCFFSDDWYCIYLFHPPGIDLLFALLVLVPFIASRNFLVLRVGGLIALSVLVHLAIVNQLIGTRGTIPIPGVDTIFGAIFPIAVVAAVVTAGLAALIAGRRIRPRLWLLAVAGGLATGTVFVASEAAGLEHAGWRPIAEPWMVWHAGICLALWFGSATRPARLRRLL